VSVYSAATKLVCQNCPVPNGLMQEPGVPGYDRIGSITHQHIISNLHTTLSWSRTNLEYMVWRLRWRLLTYRWGICRSLQAGAWNISPVDDGIRVIEGSKRCSCGRRRVQSSTAKYSPPPRGVTWTPPAAAHPSSTASCLAGVRALPEDGRML
jgi:hypothetical protein